ncbi:MAG: RNB domain-containing ribonuclease, partial [Thermodesulfovibrionales bacterium]
NAQLINRYGYLLKDLYHMAELCQILRQRRHKRGGLDFDLPEPEVILDIQGNPQDIVRAKRNLAHSIIEEFMIVTNEVVARHIESLQIPSIYRVHEKPDRDRLDETMSFLHAAGLIKTPHFGSIKDLHKFVASFSGDPLEELIFKFILKSLKQARYSTSNIGHFGLASECYTHFTSPIRRYPDLVVHRILKDIILYSEVRYPDDEMFETLLDDIASSSSRSERKADEVENKSIDVMRVWFMKDKIGEVFSGYVTNVSSYGLRVRLKDYYLEGFLHVSQMVDDYYRYDERSVRLIGAHRKKVFGIGKRLDVVVESVDMDTLEVSFGLPI